MSGSPSTINERLAMYRATLDDAIAERTAHHAAPMGGAVQSAEDNLIELDWRPTQPVRILTRGRVLTAAAAITLIVALGTLIATRPIPADIPSSATPTPVVADGKSEPAMGTAPAPTDYHPDNTTACPKPLPEAAPPGTLYLGAPGSGQNLATPGFLLSLPAATPPAVVATKTIGLAVVGLECSINAIADAAGKTVNVTVSPPAVPSELHVDVEVAELDGVIGATQINGTARFRIATTSQITTLELLDGVPAAATTASVRFKKGDDVWELRVEPTAHTAHTLTVPSGETDRFPNATIEWVLFTLLDADGQVVGVGAGPVA